MLRGRHRERAWCLPKGHLEPGEDEAAAALREVSEETGIAGEILEPLGTIRYQFMRPGERTPVRKTVSFFLMRAVGDATGSRDTTEVVEARWVALDEAIAALAYDNERRIVEYATRLLARPETAGRFG